MSTRIELSYSRYNEPSYDTESFNLTFNVNDETLGTVFEKLEVFLGALGFVVEGKELCLVDREDAKVDRLAQFLSESRSKPFGVINGDKD